MSTSKIEFAVRMTCDSCVQAVSKSLQGVVGVKDVNINLETGSVIVETTLSAQEVLKKLKESGRQVVLRGYGNIAAVSVLEAGSPSIKGVVRFAQDTSDSCLIDGTIDGLVAPGNYELAVHECGDLSKGCENVGDCLDMENRRTGKPYGSLGSFSPQANGRAVFRFDDSALRLSDIIGRSLVVSESGKRLTCGIIARSAGVFQNPKTICACDGVSIWDEQNAPKSKQ